MTFVGFWISHRMCVSIRSMGHTEVTMSLDQSGQSKNPVSAVFRLPRKIRDGRRLGRRLEENHHAKVVERQVNKLDRATVDQLYRGSGSQPYDPMTLLKMVLYQYLKGNQSPAAWYDEAKLNEAMQWLGRGYVPARRTWYDFRDRIGKFIDQLHEQIIARALDEEHLDPTVGVQDGTAVAACASRHRMVNRSTLENRTEQLNAILKGEFDDELPQWVPATDSGQLDLAERMHKASEILTERIAGNARKPSDKRKDSEKIQVSLSDPIAPLGRDKLKVFRPLYTVQYVVAPVSHLIMSYGCEPEVTDVGTLAPMIDKTQQAVRGQLKTMMADAAYCSIVDLQDCRERDIELLAPVQSNAFTQSKMVAKPNPQIPRGEFDWDEAEQCYRCQQGHRLDYRDRTRKQRHSGHPRSYARQSVGFSEFVHRLATVATVLKCDLAAFAQTEEY